MALYGVNLWGEWEPRVIQTLLGRLPYDPRSLLRAVDLGDIRWLHWDQANNQLADLFDAIQVLTQATAQRKAHLSARRRYTRPETVQSTRISSRNTAAVAAVLGKL